MTDQDKQGPINALKTKLELLTLKASLRHSSSTSFIHYNQDEHLYHRRVQEASYDPDGAIAAQKAAAEAAKPKRRPASALAMKLDIALEPPAPTSVLRPSKTAGGSRRSHKTPSHTTAAASTTRPAPIVAPPLALSMQQGRWESDEDFLDRTRSVQSIRFANINFDNNVELPLKLNAHGIISWTSNHLNIPHSHRELMDRALIHEDSLALFISYFWHCFSKFFQPNSTSFHTVVATFWAKLRIFVEQYQIQHQKQAFKPEPKFMDVFIHLYSLSIAQAVFVAFVRLFPTSQQLMTPYLLERVSLMSYVDFMGYQPAPVTLKNMIEKLVPNPILLAPIAALPRSFVLIPAPLLPRTPSALSFSPPQSPQHGAVPLSPSSVMRRVQSMDLEGPDSTTNADSIKFFDAPASPVSASNPGESPPTVQRPSSRMSRTSSTPALSRPVSRAASLLPLSATYVHHVDLANAVVSTPLEVEHQQQMRRSDSILHTTERDLERVRAAGRAAVASLRARPAIAKLDSKGISPLTQSYMQTALGRSTGPSSVQLKLSDQSSKTQCGGSVTTYAYFSAAEQKHHQKLVDDTHALRLQSNKDLARIERQVQKQTQQQQLLEFSATADQRMRERLDADPMTQLKLMHVPSVSALPSTTTGASTTLAPSASAPALKSAQMTQKMRSSATTSNLH